MQNIGYVIFPALPQTQCSQVGLGIVTILSIPILLISISSSDSMVEVKHLDTNLTVKIQLEYVHITNVITLLEK